jgi:transposase
MPKHKSEDFKMSAVEYYLTEDVSQEQVCKIFKCSPRSLMRWVEKYDEKGEIKRHNRQPVAYKIKQNEVKFILDEIKKDKTITMEDLLAKVQLKYPNFDITRRHLNRIVNDNNITLKITRFRHERLGFSKENLKPTLNNKIFRFYYLMNQLKDLVRK